MCVVACQTEAPSPKPVTETPLAQLAFTPVGLCTALNDAGLVGGKWKKGATGYSCSSDELPIGARNLSNATSSSVWYEVRGTSETSATTVVLGGDVRVPEADSAVQAKLAQLAQALLTKLKLPFDDDLKTAILTNADLERKSGDYVIRYRSQMADKFREDRLTIQHVI